MDIFKLSIKLNRLEIFFYRIPVVQVAPEKPLRQLHEKSFMVLRRLHVPPFLHGLVTHTPTCVSQNVPEKPSTHSHTGPLAESEHKPPFLQGLTEQLVAVYYSIQRQC